MFMCKITKAVLTAKIISNQLLLHVRLFQAAALFKNLVLYVQ